MSIGIGNVSVVHGEPPTDRSGSPNPYIAVNRDMSLSPISRREALRRFKHGENVDDYTFWFAPSGGGARRLTGPEEVDWKSSGIK